MRTADPISQLNASLIGRYRVEREIGAGGMATVYLARDLRHDRNVALKLLDAELGAVLGSERFLSEIRVTANLQHPNLLPLFDSGEVDGLLFYVMPFIAGETLRKRLDREKQLPLHDVIHIATAVAGALESAHRQGVIHRDLKPENVLLHEGEPLVADFGIALAVSKAGGQRVTQTGLSLGTPQYMSPEQATGDRIIDGRSDIYSLGAMIYEMLTGEPPHVGNTSQAIIARILTEEPRPVRATRPSVPEHVEVALQRALEKLPADRWDTAADFSSALKGRGTGAVSGATSASRSSARGRVFQSRLRDPVFWALAAVAMGAVVSAGYGATRSRRDERAAPVIRFPLAINRTAAGWNALRGSMAITADGESVAFVATGPLGLPVLFIRTLGEVQPRVIAGTEGAEQPFFSPDGRSLGFWAEGKLQKVSVDGGAAATLATVPRVSGATWSPRGVIVFTNDKGLATIAENGGTITQLSRPDASKSEYSQFFPVALADGETVIYASQRAVDYRLSRIGVMSLADGKSTILELDAIGPVGMVGDQLVYAGGGTSLTVIGLDVAKGRTFGAPRQVLNDVAIAGAGIANAAVSNDGSLVYQSASKDARMVSVNERGQEHLLPDEARRYSYPRVSPDGRRTAVVIGSGARSDIWIIDNSSRAPVRLTSEGTSNDRPEWTPDGSRVLYRSDRGGTSAIWWQPPEPGNAASALLTGKANYYEGVVAPDGKTIAFQIDITNADIMYRALTGDTTAHPVAVSDFVETMPRVSPDGKLIAYVSHASGVNSVMVRPFPGPGTAVQVSDRGGAEPLWSRDGHLFYRDGKSVIEVILSSTPSLSVKSRTSLFADVFAASTIPHANYDVLPDRSFLMLRAAEEPQVIVVRNWAAELRSQLAANR